MLHLLTTSRDCRHCGFQVSIEESECPRCHDNGMFRFPVFQALGVALFVAGAVTFHYYPEVGGVLIRIAGYGDIVPN